METLELQDLPVGYLSHTQVEMFRTCPQRYYYRYVKGLKMPPAFAIIKGSAGHETMNTFHRLKKETQTAMLQDEFTDCFVTELDSQINKAKDKYGEIDYTRKVKKGKEWFKEIENPQAAKSRVKNETIPSLEQYHQLELPLLNPVETEKEFTIELSTGLKIVAKVDYMDTNQIIEYKFSTKKIKLERPTNQMLLYSVVNDKLTARQDRILTKGNYQKLDTGKPLGAALSELWREYEKISTMIKTGIVYRIPGFNDMNCGMCGYKGICRKIL